MKRLFSIFVSILMICIMAFTLTACKDDSSTTDDTSNNNNNNQKSFVNPGDNLGGGQMGTMPTLLDIADDVSAIVTAGNVTYDLSGIDMDINNAVALDSSTKISASGSYVLTGDYTNGIIDKAITKNSVVHIYLNNANISSTTGSAIIKTKDKITLIITLVEGTKNTITNSVEGENTLAVKGALIINGKGSLTVTASGADASAIKVSKAFVIEDANLTISSTKHGISSEEIYGYNATINVLSAEKDGLHTECDYDNDENDTSFTFTTDSGFVTLTNVNYTCNVMGDGIQADTFVYIDGGVYNITTTSVFVQDSLDNRTMYDLVDDDFKYKKNGKSYYRVASDDMSSGTKYAMTQGTKAIKVGEIEYDSDGDDVEDQTILEGNYTIYIAGGTFNLNSDDDAIHANAGNVVIMDGTINIETYDDGITSDNYTKIMGGTITISTCFEGIEGGYVEIGGGVIDIVSSDDGINAASDDTTVNEYIYITGGTINVDASGDGIDSNGSVLVTGGTLIDNGPNSGADSGLDSETGILINGGTVFASSSLGMVETPATNSTQYVLSYAQQSSISAGTVFTIKDSSGNSIFTTTIEKSAQSIIVSLPAFENGASYTVYGGETELATFTISSIITSVGSSTQMGGQGGMGPGGQQGGFDPNSQGQQGGFDPNSQGGGMQPPSGNNNGEPPAKPQ